MALTNACKLGPPHPPGTASDRQSANEWILPGSGSTCSPPPRDPILSTSR